MKKLTIVLNFIFLINCKTVILDKNIIPNFKIEKIVEHNNQFILCGINLNNKLQLLKCDANTNIDNNFGSNGTAIINAFETTKLKINDILVYEKDNSIIISCIAFNDKNKSKVITYKIDMHGNLLFMSLIPLENIQRIFDLKITNHEQLTFGVAFNDKLSIIQLNIEGMLNKNFGSNGIATFDIPNNISGIPIEKLKLAIQNDNKILIGYCSDHKFNLIRLNDNNAIDYLFDTEISKIGRLNNILIHSNNKIIICTTKNRDIILTRLIPNGKIDEIFNKETIFSLPEIYQNQKIYSWLQRNRNIIIFSETTNNCIITTYPTNFIHINDNFKNGYISKFLEGKSEFKNKINVKIDNEVIVQTVTNLEGGWKVKIPKLIDGKHKLIIESIDEFNNTVIKKINCLIKSPPELELKIQGKTLCLNIEPKSSVKITLNKINNKKRIEIFSKNRHITNKKPVFFNTSSLSTGKYQIMAHAKDLAGNITKKELNFTI